MTAAGTLVLLYHRVADLDVDPHGLAVGPQRFAQHCHLLKRRCEVVPLREANSRRRQVTITFDDGYADNASDAREILAAEGLTATFFVTVGRIGQTQDVWWDRLAALLLASETAVECIDIHIGSRRLWLDVRSPAARARAHWALFWRLRPLHPSTIESVLHDIEAQLGAKSHARDSHRWMDAEDLRRLATTDGMDIGAHTLTHPFLSTLRAEEQREEIEGSRHRLECLIGRRVTSFSYPYGGADAFTEQTTRLVRDAGYTIACTAAGGIARPDHDPLQWPRNVVGDWDVERFDRWLDGWLRRP